MTNYLLYGRGRLKVSFPAFARVTVIRKPKMPVIADTHLAVQKALEHTVADSLGDAKPLVQLARNARSVCIAICDVTRPVPNGLFLRPLIETLCAAGIPLEAITILVATGLHRPNIGKELEELIGDSWVLRHVDVQNHFARCDEDHVDLGTTRTRGTRVRIDRRFVDADLRIVTGLVEPHFMAGYSGGRKVIAPGLAHVDTITTFHNSTFMADPAAANCNLVGNPLHEEQLEIVHMIGRAFALNTVIDEDRNLSMVNFGEVIASHREAVKYVDQYCRVAVPTNFGTVVTSAAGYPLDKTYYQTVKGMVGAIGILKPGGSLVVASECSEGLGSPEFAAAQRELIRLGAHGFLNTLRSKPYADIDEWQTQMQTKAMAVGKIHLFSNLGANDRGLTGVSVTDDLEKTIQSCVETSSCKTLAVIPEGPYLVPYCSETVIARR